MRRGQKASGAKPMKNERSMSAGFLGFHRRSRAGWLCVVAGSAVVAIAAGAGLLSSHAQSSPAQAAATSIQPATGQQAQQAIMPTAESLQQQQVADEAADLLKMATDLKAAVDKTTKDTLSVGVIRKAGQIEQLAHKVRTGTGKS